MITKYTIYGERCSGTNYLENLINKNFDVDLTWEHGWKHFFGCNPENMNNSDNTLFICIVRNPVDWINSFFRELHHFPFEKDENWCNMSYEEKVDFFLHKEFYSVFNNSDDEIMDDRNIYTGNRYKNIFELRHTKLKWMLEDLPKKVKNYMFITHEELINDFEHTINKIKNKGLIVKDNVNFPENTTTYKKNKNKFYIKKNNEISSDVILNNLITHYEKKLKYI